MSNTIIIPNRLNWIDWAKVFAISFVVFGHIPQEPGSFPSQYIVTFHMPLFYFISGYLTKTEYLNRVTIKKYWFALIIPYIIYNILFYPYWFTRYIMEAPNGEWFNYVKPFIGTLLLQIPTSISEPLNQVTWFIAVLLVMKIVLAICNLSKRKNYYIIFISIIFAYLYIVNNKYLFSHSITTDGLLKCMPFFLMGHLCKQEKIIQEARHKYDWIFACIGIGTSIISYLFIGRDTSDIYWVGLRFWAICFPAVLGILCLCKCLEDFHSTIIDNISIGTIVIMGLHWMLIGTTNYIITKLLHIEGDIKYSLPIAISLTVIFEALLYPLILLFKNKYLFMLGKKQKTKN